MKVVELFPSTQIRYSYIKADSVDIIGFLHTNDHQGNECRATVIPLRSTCLHQSCSHENHLVPKQLNNRLLRIKADPNSEIVGDYLHFYIRVIRHYANLTVIKCSSKWPPRRPEIYVRILDVDLQHDFWSITEVKALWYSITLDFSNTRAMWKFPGCHGNKEHTKHINSFTLQERLGAKLRNLVRIFKWIPHTIQIQIWQLLSSGCH